MPGDSQQFDLGLWKDIVSLQQQVITAGFQRSVLDQTLELFMRHTESEQGFIAERMASELADPQNPLPFRTLAQNFHTLPLLRESAEALFKRSTPFASGVEAEQNWILLPIAFEADIIGLVWLSRKEKYLDPESEVFRHLLQLCSTLLEAGWQVEIQHKKESLYKTMMHTNHLILESAGEGIYGVDTEERVFFANPAALEMLGYAEEELINRPLPCHAYHLLDHPDECPVHAALKNGETRTVTDEVFIRRDGHKFPTEYVVSPIRHRGQVIGAVIVFRDVTESQHTEALLRWAFDTPFVGKAIASTENKLIKVNDAFCQMLGYTAEELHDKGLETLTYPGDPIIGFRVMAEHDAPFYSVTKRYIRKDGQIVWAIVSITLVKGPDGQPLYMIGQMMDITALKLNERIIKESEERFRQAFFNSPIGKALTSPEGKWLLVNPALARMTGYSTTELETMSFQHITHPDDLSADAGYLKAMKTGEKHHCQFEKRYIHKEGHIIWALVSVSVVHDDQGQAAYFVSQILDISERKRYEEQLHQAKSAAENTAKIKAEFLATISHEIRTPLHSVLGTLSLLRTTPLNEDQQEYLNTLQMGSEALMGIVNEVLDLSHLESGKAPLNIRAFPLKELLVGTLNLMQPKAQEKRLVLRLSLEPSIPAAWTGDPDRLQQVLVNLIGNAINYTPHGYVEVSASFADADQQQMMFRVQDTGVGIPSDKRNVIFESFTRLDQQKPGSGLGLSICKRLVGLMGGEIGVESELGKGSVFYFTVPLLSATNRAPQPAPSMTGTLDKTLSARCPMAILIAEDHETNQIMLQKILAQFGYQADVVGSGTQVIQQLTTQHYDLILMDVQMPDLDGFETTRRIREQLPRQKQPVIIAMTAFSMAEDRQRCLDSGMDDYLNKPIHVEALAKSLEQWFQKTLERNASPAVDIEMLESRFQHDNEALRQMGILFCEESQTLIQQMQEAMAAGNQPRLKDLAHSLRGVCLNFGAAPLAKLAGKLETGVRESLTEPELTQCFNLIVDEHTIVERQLQQWLTMEVLSGG